MIVSAILCRFYLVYAKTYHYTLVIKVLAVFKRPANKNARTGPMNFK